MAEIAQLVAELTSTDDARRAAAAERLAQQGAEACDAAVALARACGDPCEEVCQWAAAALEELGPPPVEQLAALAALLGEASADAGYWAATLLGRLQAAAAPAVPALAAAVAGRGPMAVRQRAAWALGQIGPAARPAAECLQRATADPDSRLSSLAQQALEQL
jgi:HEAT repeat protein